MNSEVGESLWASRVQVSSQSVLTFFSSVDFQGSRLSLFGRGSRGLTLLSQTEERLLFGSGSEAQLMRIDEMSRSGAVTEHV